MDRVPSVVAGGIAGTAVLTLSLLLLEVQTREQIRMFDVIARFVGLPEQTTVGFVLFIVAGVLAWPLLFLAVEGYLPFGPDPAARGAVMAVALWIAFAYAGRGTLSGPLLLIYAGYTFFAHIAYGFILGAVYAHLHEEVRLPREEYA
jgi:hypothetical protein